MKLKLKPRDGGNAPAQSPVPDLTHKRLARLESLLAERGDRGLPIWIRAPKSGAEHFTGFSRAKLYDGAAKGHFRSVSIRERGQTRGTALWNLQSVLDYIAKCEAAAAAKGGNS